MTREMCELPEELREMIIEGVDGMEGLINLGRTCRQMHKATSHLISDGCDRLMVEKIRSMRSSKGPRAALRLVKPRGCVAPRVACLRFDGRWTLLLSNRKADITVDNLRGMLSCPQADVAIRVPPCRREPCRLILEQLLARRRHTIHSGLKVLGHLLEADFTLHVKICGTN
jgi:hypothetical protein